jgi:hypothetical protein
MPLMLHLLFTLTQHSQKPWEKRISRWLENHFMRMDNRALFITDENGSEK